MAGFGKARQDISARMITGVALLAAVFTVGGANPADAQQPAPIVYKTAATTHTPTVCLENKADPMALNIAPHARIPTFADSPNPDPFDLRPGATNASFGPAVPVAAMRVEQPRALASTAVTAATPFAGPPYQVAGRWYVPAHEPSYDEVGIASWYGPTFHGKDSASGEVFDELAMTAAHPTLPIPSLVRVTNMENGKSVVVRLNDRGPFVDDRIIDLSKAAGAALDMHAKGTAKVRVQYVGPAPADADALPAQAGVKPAPVQQMSIAAQPVAPLAAPAALAPRAIEQRGFFLQAGSFADLGNANQLRDKLRSSGPVTVTAVTVNGTEFYRVMVGSWATREEAEQAQARFAGAGTKTLVVAKLD